MDWCIKHVKELNSTQKNAHYIFCKSIKVFKHYVTAMSIEWQRDYYVKSYPTAILWPLGEYEQHRAVL